MTVSFISIVPRDWGDRIRMSYRVYKAPFQFIIINDSFNQVRFDLTKIQKRVLFDNASVADNQVR